jgi:hypothetical protein
MPLHRDIHWIGRQWAVTGHGMQLIDQKLKGFFDVEASRLWEEALIETMRAKEWLDAADFGKGLEVARKRFPAGGVTPSPPVASTAVPAAPPVASIAPSPVAASIASIKLRPQVAKLEVPRPRKIDPVASPPASPVALQPPAMTTSEPEAAQREPPTFHMLFSGYAKFIRPWRVRMKK